MQNGDEGTFEGGYTVDGRIIYDTLAAMTASLEEDRIKTETAKANQPTSKEEVITTTFSLENLKLE